MRDKLLEQQCRLQDEANTVIDDLALTTLLATAGTPVRVGSSALGLMVWRDIDLTVVCSTLREDIVADIGTQLMTRRGIREVRFVNDSGDLQAESSYPDGLYLGLRYMSGRGTGKSTFGLSMNQTDNRTSSS